MATPPPPQPPPPPPPGYPAYPPQPQQPPPGRPLPTDRSQVRPRSVWYWIAGAIAALAIGGSILIFSGGDEDIGSLTDVFSTLEQLEVPGAVTVDLAEDDEWAIYRSLGDTSFDFEDQGTSSLDCRVRDPGGSLVPLAGDFGFGNVTLNNETYVTEYTFTAPESGAYEVSCTGGNGPAEEVLVGENVEIGEIFGFFGRVALGIVILLLGLLATLAIALPVWLVRSKRIRDARRAGVYRG
jgi:hypothetical protein